MNDNDPFRWISEEAAGTILFCLVVLAIVWDTVRLFVERT